jgi:hypothetical protein
MRRTIAILALAGVTGLLAGCGGKSGSSTSTTTTTTAAAPATTAAATPLSKAAYATRLKAVGRGLSASISTIQTDTPAHAAASLQRVQEDVRNAQKQLDAMTPPADVAIPHQNLAAAVGEFADELGPIIAKLRAGNMAALQTVQTLPALRKIATATSAITAAGYKITG